MQYTGSWVGLKGDSSWVRKILSHTDTLHQTVQPVMRCPTNYGIMALLDVVTGAIFIVDSFNVGHIFLSLCITQSSISPLSQHTTLCIIHRSISPLSQHTTLCILYRSISPLSQHTTLCIIHRSISPLSQHTTLCIAECGVLCCFKHTAVRVCAALCLLLHPYFFHQASSTFAKFLYTG